MTRVLLDYEANCGLEPHDPALPLGFWSVSLGEASFSDEGLLVTVDDDPGARAPYTTEPDPNYLKRHFTEGRYYRRQFAEDEIGPRNSVSIRVTVKVLKSSGSPAATCVQFTTREGRTFGLGFLRNEESPDADRIVLYADGGEYLVPTEPLFSSLDWMWRPVILGTYSLPVNVMRTYVLELVRSKAGSVDDDIVRLHIEGTGLVPITAPLADLRTRVTVPGLRFGHVLKQGTGKAEWKRLTVTTDSPAQQPELPRRIGATQQMFMDDWIIDSRENLERRMGTPEKSARRSRCSWTTGSSTRARTSNAGWERRKSLPAIPF